MRKVLLALPALFLLGACEHINLSKPDPNGDDMSRADCGLGGAHTPAGPADWVCETENDTYRQTDNPVYPTAD